ncbi:tRNA (guanine(46)-N(7))-methyltransferase TrmB [Ferrimonas lipolytica]|uniref:tRNA (guanine(46)-N(7))-methyltransferase n=1 Tax=Ferrimonas lipolytica TaxID=2724191 RepID=A0A6H1U8Z5_9GAMM|nr:SAM-dependent methyltransferase [Ferrimonas lipolytica]QIZ75511.1 SAM-dependent methyltransferase [Ferrimonas lipolytica]
MNNGNSRAIESNQQGLHENLDATVQRHLQHQFRAPYAAHSIELFEQLKQWKEQDGRPLVLDSCCGVGESTANLAKRHPDAIVLGMDKSAARVDKHEHYHSGVDNYRVVRANLNDLWRMMAEDNWQPSHHYLLYPNPWPKSSHLQRRWHGGPLFPSLLALGGQLELRSNWQIYLSEFQRALQLAGHDGEFTPMPNDQPLTPFERKYGQSGQPLYRLVADLTIKQ